MPNRLAAESSLYLRQHARNPVDWFPWGAEALARARDLDRPIFLSIGYSACHWCHVMEHESFEDEATARVLNEHFVCIKVDREERPDLDTIYMNSLHALTREGGGWPLSVFLTPNATPFYAGTYYPPDERYAAHGKPSFRRLLKAIIEAWTHQRDHLVEIGRNVVGFLQTMAQLPDDTATATRGADLLQRASQALRRAYDPLHGGFGQAPKFPHALELKLLLRLVRRFDDKTALSMVRQTLDQMARGGIYDQVGGGFHRYSVDARWLVPHFEKMLYDNALLAAVYVEAWQLTHEPYYEQIARETLDYVLKEMTAPSGAFYSTQDADSEGEEGKFYIWSRDELHAALGADLGDFACRVWHVTEHGNFEGHNILHRTASDLDDARALGLSLDQFRERLYEVKHRLYDVRSRRVWPGRDEKILTAWNGLMIAAFAQAGAAFAEPRYLAAAESAATYLIEQLRTPEGRMFRTVGVGQPPKLNGYLEDYAFCADAFISLYQATFNISWLHHAAGFADTIVTHFADPEGPGFYFVADDHETLIARTKDLHDGSTPSGNAMAATALLRLAKLLDRRDFAARADAALRGLQQTMHDHPVGSGQLLAALDFHHGPTQEIAVIGRTNSEDTRRALHAIHTAWGANRVVAFHDPDRGTPPRLIPWLADKPMVNDEVTVYVCENFTCRSPVVGLAAITTAFAEHRA